MTTQHNSSHEAYKPRFVDIIVDAFEHNPSVLDVVKQDSKTDQRLRGLAEYAFELGERRSGNYLTSDKNGIVISYVEDKKRSLADHLANCKLILQVSGISRAKYLLQKEAYRNHVHPKEPFYYVWFIGVDSRFRGGDSVKELREKVFDDAKQHQLPILLETTIEKNKRVYEYFGFRVYHTHRFHPNMPPTYFMKREVSC